MEKISYRPLPPQGAAYAMYIPPIGADGRRVTVNRNLTEDGTVWHFRSAWNVAALNCTAPQYAPIADGYRAYITDHARELKQLNDRIDRLYRSEMGSRRDGIVAREGEMTSVYNFFALPPARAGFCRAALAMANRALAAPPADPIAFALNNFATLEAPFETFFTDYERYEQLSADWDRKYGERYGYSQPGWVAVQKARASGASELPTAGVSDPTTTLATQPRQAGAIADPDTGTTVPIVPVDEGFISQPVVEPIPQDTPGDGTVAVPPGDTGPQDDVSIRQN
ncbi:MAG: hypothetical protein AAF941_02610 [Pseudomonadota bacterium]